MVDGVCGGSGRGRDCRQEGRGGHRSDGRVGWEGRGRERQGEAGRGEKTMVERVGWRGGEEGRGGEGYRSILAVCLVYFLRSRVE